MALKIIGSAECPVCDQLAPVGLSRAGAGRAVHLLCAPCGVNLQARRSSAYGLRLMEQARGLDPLLSGPTALEALSQPTETPAVVREATEVPELEPEPEPAPQREPEPEADPVAAGPPDGDPYLAGLP